MTDLHRTWRATFTRRWHSNPDLCQTHDPVGAHSARVALIMLALWPDTSREAIVAALMHDLAESVVGDLPPAGKSMLANAATAERLIATQNGWHIALKDVDATRLRFADQLDAFMWADHHRATDTDEWHDAREMLVYQAERLGVRKKLEDIL